MSAFGVHASERVALFIDGPSLYASARNLGFDIDYRKLISHLDGACRFHRAHYYTLLPEGEEYSPVRPLVDWLDFNGYTVTTKIMRDFGLDEATGRRRIKGSISVEVAVDLVTSARTIEHCMLISGDGELAYAVEQAQRNNAKVTVISSMKTNPVAVAEDLRRSADRFIELDSLRDIIGKPIPPPRDATNVRAPTRR